MFYTSVFQRAAAMTISPDWNFWSWSNLPQSLFVFAAHMCGKYFVLFLIYLFCFLYYYLVTIFAMSGTEWEVSGTIYTQLVRDKLSGPYMKKYFQVSFLSLWCSLSVRSMRDPALEKKHFDTSPTVDKCVDRKRAKEQRIKPGQKI
jgi:hypothetical protein